MYEDEDTPVTYEGAVRLLEAIIMSWRADSRRSVYEQVALARFLDVSVSDLERLLAATGRQKNSDNSG